MTMAASTSGTQAKGATERFAGVYSGTDPQNRHRPQTADGRSPLRCTFCLEPVAYAKDRISVEGSHIHVFTNPSGIVFEIGCFALAPGCRTVGQASDEFTWFPGCTWQIAVCGKCTGHLGWCFASESARFWALILDRLV